MQLHQVQAPKGSNGRRRIVGRGRGSGLGKRSGRGQTGQNSRAGRGVILGSEGGQMNLLRRLPKVGFNSKWPTRYQIVNIESLGCFKNGDAVDVNALKSANLIKSLNRPVKILSDGDLKLKLTVHAHRFSKAAVEKITKAGGKAEVIKSTKPEAPQTKSMIRAAGRVKK